MNDLDYITPSYDDIDLMTERVFKKILGDNFQPDVILAIARGGWLPGRVFSDLFQANGQTPEVRSITTSFYIGVGERKRRPVLKQELDGSLFNQSVLIVDDVSDTGETLQFAMDYVKFLGANNIKVATVYCKTKTTLIPDYYDEMIDSSVWIVFPYERREFQQKTGVNLDK
ncbi:MAG: phosphoribosyltransferase [Promethearchaeota archaeon]